jgi:thymidine phosphorylase
MLAQELIRIKRDGGTLDASRRSSELVAGIADGLARRRAARRTGDGRLHLNGMNEAECVALTLAMRDSGRVMRWDDPPCPARCSTSTPPAGR